VRRLGSDGQEILGLEAAMEMLKEAAMPPDMR